MDLLEQYKTLITEQKNIRNLLNYPDEFIDFSSNDYLGLSKNNTVIDAGCKAAMWYGAGSTGSRLLSGNKQIFFEFEIIIAKDKKMESALIFNSGFQANSGILECLSDKSTTIIFDKLNHASMYQGIFASGANLLRFNHLDYDHLESLLKKENLKNIIIASETVFGMDGDIANISILSDLSNRYGTILYLDEAHATGLYGENGYGLSTHHMLNPETTIIMGTLSKAIGSSGAYVACSQLIKDYLVKNCKSFIYSTALSPFCIGAAMYAWNLLPSLSEVRKKLLNTSQNLRNQLKYFDLEIKGEGTNIIPIIYKNVEEIIKIKEKCIQNGIIISGVTKPTSPTPRIRIAICAHHSFEDIQKLLQNFTQ
ncbi:MAG: pyridoxal phosphate-dependent aminotransferase family protein [Puniceicoccales bacterium]|jgi:8-amino-7-oxononanoate synthase|nr:pyridoxal phosphate-dependent aminotransferase family protein [Puniceicoccales bacterium]